MVRRPSENLSRIRRYQRSHAKKRFSERFGLTLNRDLLREIEQKIARGEVILIEKKPQIRNYLVAIQGKLIAVGYNTFSKRVVTALPDEYLGKLRLETIHIARFKLLKDDSGVKADIVARRHSQLLYRENEAVSYYLVRYPGLTFKTGYDFHADRLVPYVKQSASGYSHKMSARDRFGLLGLDPAVAEEVRQKIRSSQSTFLWRYSDAIAFHEIEIGTQFLRVGYSKINGTLYNCRTPTDDQQCVQ